METLNPETVFLILLIGGILLVMVLIISLIEQKPKRFRQRKRRKFDCFNGNH